jgi:hypothetical protein
MASRQDVAGEVVEAWNDFVDAARRGRAPDDVDLSAVPGSDTAHVQKTVKPAAQQRDNRRPNRHADATIDGER